MGKKISIALCVVLAVVLGLIVYHEFKLEAETDALYQEMNAETSSLSSEVTDLQKQIDALEDEAEAAQIGTATTQFLTTDLSAECYQAVLLPLTAYGFPVCMAVSLAELPGAEGCLTLEQAQELVSQGWYYCYAYDAEEAAALLGEADADELTDAEASEALSLWLAAVSAAAEAQGLELNSAVYFPSGAFREGFAEALKAQGVQAVIHHGELGAGLLTASEEDGLWYAGAVWWRSNEILASKLYTISASGGEFVTVVGIPDSSTTLDDWMTQYDAIVSAQAIEVTDFSEMVETQEANASVGAETAAEVETQIAALEAQIAELNAQIEEIQDKYLEQVRSLES